MSGNAGKRVDDSIAATLLTRFAAIVGHAQVLVGETDVAKYGVDWRGRYRGHPLAVLRPGTTEEVSEIVNACAISGTPIVPQGGNTGLCGGATPDSSGTEVVLSLGRLNRIREIDLANETLTAEAGCVLASVQSVAEENGRLFGVSLAAEGSCMIGGNIATNAGGIQVLRYGTMRDQVLGLEVVLPSGQIWDGLRGLRKDNTGYDLKHLFIGAEGTLGVITAAVLKLHPKPLLRATTLAAVASLEDAVELYRLVQSACAGRLSAFEAMAGACLRLVADFQRRASPFADLHPYYVLFELTDSCADTPLNALVERVLGIAIDNGLVRDAVLAASEGQRTSLWSLREDIPEAQAKAGHNFKHDVALPIARLAEFVQKADGVLAHAFPGIEIQPFGHLGDGNLHYNLIARAGDDRGDVEQLTAAIALCVHDCVARFGGSISAEHGLGQSRRDEITRYKSSVELALMRTVKNALDPSGLMNPGKVLAG